MRLEDRVNVIGHDHPRVELVEPAHRLAIQQRAYHHPRDSWILQPDRTGSHPVELLVVLQEGTWDRRSVFVVCLGCSRREGAGQTPRHEDSGLLRNPVREMSASEGHRGLARATDHKKRWSVPLFLRDSAPPPLRAISTGTVGAVLLPSAPPAQAPCLPAAPRSPCCPQEGRWRRAAPAAG